MLSGFDVEIQKILCQDGNSKSPCQWVSIFKGLLPFNRFRNERMVITPDRKRSGEN
ncbi:hypothetical protein HN51_064761, partial [Arachis hypogaea]